MIYEIYNLQLFFYITTLTQGLDSKGEFITSFKTKRKKQYLTIKQ